MATLVSSPLRADVAFLAVEPSPGGCDSGAVKKPYDIHQFLRAWRKKKGLSQEHVANKLGLVKSTIQRWETGARAVDLSDLYRLAKLYEVDPVCLLLAPDDPSLAARLTRAKAVMTSITPEAADRWLATGDDIAGHAPEKKLPEGQQTP